MAFQLTKTWVDSDPGVTMVEIRYTCSAFGEPAVWDGRESAEVMTAVPNTVPRVRHAAIEIPRYLHDRDAYLLHHRFLYVQHGREQFSPVFSEEIVSRDIGYTDAEGRITEVRVLWGVGGFSAPNWTKASLEGLSLPRPNDREREADALTDDAMYELIQTVPLPRRYVARVWGPRGSTVEYAFQLLRTASPKPEDDFETWDNDGGRNYRLVLA